MNSQTRKAQLFHQLHNQNTPLILVNIWDVGSAKIIQETGAKAIATGSWSVAASFGYEDGENLPFDLALDNVKRIIAATDLPVTVDVEAGYGDRADEIKHTIKSTLEAGAVGVNLEDQVIGTFALYSIEDQCARIKSARAEADKSLVPLFINARTDIFLKADANQHSADHLAEAIERASAYAEAGANGFFVPGLKEAKFIQKICQDSPLPINIMITPDMMPMDRLMKLGVSRISYGPTPYIQVMNELQTFGVSALLMQSQ